MSGSYGSAKSTLMAHLAITHCLFNPGAVVCLCRKALPDIKDTIYREIVEHISVDLNDGFDYTLNETRGGIKFRNGSKIISRSWSDKKYKKFRSLNLSMLVFEELVENNDEDAEAFMEAKARLRRVPGIKENVLIAATNPDSPGHWVHEYFIEKPEHTRRVFYSVTKDNPFLDDVYVQQLMRDLDPKAVRRYIYGQWVELAKEVVYYAYSKENNYRNYAYKPTLQNPIHLSWDFNIGHGKPLSVAVIEYTPLTDGFDMHIFNQVVVDGMRTEGSLEELAGKGLLDMPVHYIINADGTGRHRDTRNTKSDIDIIHRFLSNYKTASGKPLDFEIDVPLANPAIKLRHNRMNAMFCNALGEHRAFVYKDAKMADKAFRLTQLKKGGNYIEDDSKDYQHIGTACGYSLIARDKRRENKPQGTVTL